MADILQSDIIDDTKRYFRQQSELYGDEWVLRDMSVLEGWNHSTQPSLKSYRDAVCHCQKCDLAETRTHFVFGTGDPRARLMLIGEAPGKEEDLQGEPFVGQAGRLLNKILAAIGFQREEVYIGNILKCRPPGNRDPLPQEVETCLPHMVRQVDIIRPGIILLLGRIAAHAWLDTTDSLGKLRGKIHQSRGIPTVVTYHPAALLRDPKWKRPVWEDVQMVRRLYDERIGDKPKWQPFKK